LYDFILNYVHSIRLQVWAKGAKPSNAGESDTECKETSWGLGANITTKLVNPAGEVWYLHAHYLLKVKSKFVSLPCKFRLYFVLTHCPAIIRCV